MVPGFNSVHANLQQKPKHSVSSDFANCFVIGDLHGNLKKLLYFLDCCQIVFPDTDDYEVFTTLVRELAASLNTQHFIKKMFMQRVMSLCAHSRKDKRIVLLGDELADRVGNDFLMLFFIVTLAKNTSLSVVLSNHTFEFIRVMEHWLKVGFSSDTITPCMNETFTASLHNLKKWLNNDIVSFSELKILYNDYKKHIKLLDYSLQEQGISIYSHARIDIQAMELVAKRLNVPFNARSKESLAHSIDEINAAFQQHYVAKNRISELCEHRYGDVSHMLSLEDHLKKEKYEVCAIKEMLPVDFILWNRGEQLSHINTPLSLSDDSRVIFIHGHDECSYTHEGAVSLDNLLGKANDGSLDREPLLSYAVKEKSLPKENKKTFSIGDTTIPAVNINKNELDKLLIALCFLNKENLTFYAKLLMVLKNSNKKIIDEDYKLLNDIAKTINDLNTLQQSYDCCVKNNSLCLGENIRALLECCHNLKKQLQDMFASNQCHYLKCSILTVKIHCLSMLNNIQMDVLIAKVAELKSNTLDTLSINDIHSLQQEIKALKRTINSQQSALLVKVEKYDETLNIFEKTAILKAQLLFALQNRGLMDKDVGVFLKENKTVSVLSFNMHNSLRILYRNYVLTMIDEAKKILKAGGHLPDAMQSQLIKTKYDHTIDSTTRKQIASLLSLPTHANCRTASRECFFASDKNSGTLTGSSDVCFSVVM